MRLAVVSGFTKDRSLMWMGFFKAPAGIAFVPTVGCFELVVVLVVVLGESLAAAECCTVSAIPSTIAARRMFMVGMGGLPWW